MLPNTSCVKSIECFEVSRGKYIVSEYKANLKACKSNFYTAVNFTSVRAIVHCSMAFILDSSRPRWLTRGFSSRQLSADKDLEPEL